MEQEKAQQKENKTIEAKMPEETKQKTPKKSQKIKVTNCANCNKMLKKRRWYYRNSKHYCNKRCWKAAKAKTAAKKEEAATQS